MNINIQIERASTSPSSSWITVEYSAFLLVNEVIKMSTYATLSGCIHIFVPRRLTLPFAPALSISFGRNLTRLYAVNRLCTSGQRKRLENAASDIVYTVEQL